ncbi:MAG: homogentisate 1,2-dioxygenase [Bdellovibrionaceae bacterium]|jgi:homogentisate 1,2-dioxygenase|nr:homogentisate 1,2-dioxygenase [Pseudobdellovibrionaceae bacterium]
MYNHFRQGVYTVQAHKAIPEGCFEEEQGRKGFFGPVSHLIRPEPSTRWTQIEGDLRPHLFDTPSLPQLPGVWQRLLYNHDVTLYWYQESVTTEAVHSAFRNADGETLYFCHAGAGSVATEYGDLEYKTGHYVLIPKCVAHAFRPTEASTFLVIENRRGLFREPDRGMLGKNAVYDPTAFGRPDIERQKARVKEGLWDIKKITVKRGGRLTAFFYDRNYFDVLGWKGDYYPVTLHIQDLMPLLSARVHLPPSAHTTFVADQFVVCTFLPRPLESDPDALKVPFYHQNIDYDEVLFYHAGNFFSRDNLKAGMITLHPAGFPHGPHPKAVKSIGNKTHTDEVAVMVDTWNALEIDPVFTQVEVPSYWQSWQEK